MNIYGTRHVDCFSSRYAGDLVALTASADYDGNITGFPTNVGTNFANCIKVAALLTGRWSPSILHSPTRGEHLLLSWDGGVNATNFATDGKYCGHGAADQTCPIQIKLSYFPTCPLTRATCTSGAETIKVDFNISRVLLLQPGDSKLTMDRL